MTHITVEYVIAIVFILGIWFHVWTVRRFEDALNDVVDALEIHNDIHYNNIHSRKSNA